ncbi:MAG: hypothetical protein QXR44_01625 [Thermoproteota archaeon]
MLGPKVVVLVTLLIASIFSSCLLTYENFLLKNDVTTLRDKLEGLRVQYNCLVEKRGYLKSSRSSLAGRWAS